MRRMRRVKIIATLGPASQDEQTIEELSCQIAEQWKVIERMQRKLDALADRFLALEEQAAPDVPITKPPHW